MWNISLQVLRWQVTSYLKCTIFNAFLLFWTSVSSLFVFLHACAHVCAPFCELHVGEEEEVSSEQWYSGKDCSVLVDVCVGGHCGVGGSLGLWLLREIRNYLVCFQFKCKFWKREHLNMCRDTKNRGKWIVRIATLRAPVYYLLLAIASNILRARCGGIITSAREWPQ